jgi:aldose 1-epimerase
MYHDNDGKRTGGNAMTLDRRAFTLAAAAALVGCAPKSEEQGSTKMNRQSFGKTNDGDAIDLYTLRNSNGMEAAIMNYGGVVQALRLPGKSGAAVDVVNGFDDLSGYLQVEPYFGALVGRYGNRIGNARFKLDGVEYKLPTNDGKNTLHGGKKGFDKRVWSAKEVTSGGGQALQLTYTSKDGEEGFPGNLTCMVTYTLTNKNELRLEYYATADKPTVLNLTNHSYFNLAGQGEGDILGHEVMIEADRCTPVDSTLIPTGELRNVAGTPLDFRQPRVIGDRINADDEQIRFGKGYDHNWVLNHSAGALSLAARVREPKSGRVMEVLTDQPGLQFYTGNFLDGTLHGKGGKVYPQRSALCMETQHFPDSPNRPEFPSTALRPGQEYKTTTEYRFPV